MALNVNLRLMTIDNSRYLEDPTAFVVHMIDFTIPRLTTLIIFYVMWPGFSVVRNSV